MPQTTDQIITDAWPSVDPSGPPFSGDLLDREQGITGLNVGREIAAERALQKSVDGETAESQKELGLPEFMLLAGVVLLLGVGLLCLWQVRSRITRRKQATPPPRTQISQIKQRREEHTGTAHLQGELQVLSQKLATQMANRAKQLEYLLDQADERIAELTKQLAKVKDNANETNMIPSEDDADMAIPTASLDPLSKCVYDRADLGQNAIEIAQSLDEQVGKIELILALRKTQAGSTRLLS